MLPLSKSIHESCPWFNQWCFTFIKVDPWIVGPDLEGLGVENGEPVDDVSAEVGVHVLRQVLALVETVGGPVGEIWQSKYC